MGKSPTRNHHLRSNAPQRQNKTCQNGITAMGRNNTFLARHQATPDPTCIHLAGKQPNVFMAQRRSLPRTKERSAHKTQPHLCQRDTVMGSFVEGDRTGHQSSFLSGMMRNNALERSCSGTRKLKKIVIPAWVGIRIALWNRREMLDARLCGYEGKALFPAQQTAIGRAQGLSTAQRTKRTCAIHWTQMLNCLCDASRAWQQTARCRSAYKPGVLKQRKMVRRSS